jgi:hypothetical protein
MRRAILALILAALAWFPATASAAQAPTVVHVWRANLDGDAHTEHVRLMLRLEPNPFGGTLPIREQVFYHGFDGGAGAVPGVHRNPRLDGDGEARAVVVRATVPRAHHNGHRYRYDVATPTLENLAAAGTPGLEVHLVQGEAVPSDADCCPSQLLTRNYRFDSGIDRWVLYKTLWRHT